MIDSHSKERNFSPDSDCKAVPLLPPLLSYLFLKKNAGKENKNVRPCSFAKVCIGARVLFSVLTFAVVAHPPVAVFAFALV